MRSWLRRHSAAYTAFSFGIQKSATMRQVLERFGVARDIEALSGKNTDDDAVITSSARQVVQLVHGLDAVVLIIPSRGLWHGTNTAVELRVHNRFVGLLRDAGLVVVDLKPDLEKSGKPLDYYFATDPHWNAKGHALAGEKLFENITRKLRLEEKS